MTTTTNAKANKPLQLSKHLGNMQKQAKQVRDVLEKLDQKVVNRELPTAQGISLLEVKFQTLLEYISDLSFISLLKLNGKPIENHPVVKRLIENRVVLEKIKPLEQRLRYQIDKLLRLASLDDEPKAETKSSHSSKGEVDPLAFKPNPGLLLTRDDDDSDNEQDGDISKIKKSKNSDLESDISEDEDPTKGGVYKAPKMVPVPYEEDATLKVRRERAEQRIMEKAARSRLVQDLMSEYDHRPEVSAVSGNGSGVGTRDAMGEKEATERLRYEEDNFTRLGVNRKQKRRLKEGFKRLDDEFSNLNDFVGLSGLNKVDQDMKNARKSLLKQRKPGNSKRGHEGDGNGRDDDGDMSFTQHKVKRMRQGKFQNLKRWKSKSK
ncbi:hypothetical protein H4219_001661 [Mycoemilia scoparia]|uniref:Neuroguidin n=1 Tax=Mycoemilia scoparia TaxID=417184 RepID=A0A9W8A5A1_9FUNG|nr:hypothetical protein H4219_001661 [Mycoemilia scoparia]